MLTYKKEPPVAFQIQIYKRNFHLFQIKPGFIFIFCNFGFSLFPLGICSLITDSKVSLFPG